MTMALILKRANASRPSGQWPDDNYDVFEDGVIVGRIFCLDAVGPQGRPWMWASGHNGNIQALAEVLSHFGESICTSDPPHLQVGRW